MMCSAAMAGKISVMMKYLLRITPRRGVYDILTILVLIDAQQHLRVELWLTMTTTCL